MRMQIEEKSPGVGSLVEFRLRPAAPSTGLQPTLSVMSLGGVSTSRYDIKDRDENLCWSHWANLTALGWLGLATKANTGSPFTTKNCFRTPRSCIVALLHCCIVAVYWTYLVDRNICDENLLHNKLGPIRTGDPAMMKVRTFQVKIPIKLFLHFSSFIAANFFKWLVTSDSSQCDFQQLSVGCLKYL